MEDETVFLPLDWLRFSVKKRRGVSPRRVEELRRQIESGHDVLPIRVRRIADGVYTVADGRHRIAAHLALGISFIEAYVTNLVDRIQRFFKNRGFKFFHGFLFPKVFK